MSEEAITPLLEPNEMDCDRLTNAPIEAKMCWTKLKKFCSSWSFNARWSNSLEPVILLFWGGYFLVSGAEVSTDMLYRKICEVGMHEPKWNCTHLSHFEDLNLTDIEYLKELKLRVTKEVNLFFLYGNLIKFIPPILISFVGGTLFDNFNKKVFLFIPLFFASIEPLAEFVNFYFFYDLPVAFMYLTYGTWSFGGGGAMWYLAEYGYISLVSRPEDRVGRLSRVDAMETLASLAIMPLSASVFHLVGYCGIHGVKLVMYYAGLLYIIVIIKEPESSQNMEERRTTCEEICTKMATSICEMWKTLFKQRTGYMRALLLIQMINFFLLNTLNTGFHLIYAYVKAIFDVSGEEYANFKEIETISQFLCLLILVPVISKTFGVSDSIFVSIVSLSSSAGLFLASAATSYTWFCVGRLSIPLYYSTWLLLRSMLVSSIDKEEIGRIFGVVAIIGAVAEYSSAPLFRYIFDASIGGDYPGLFLLVMAILYLLMGFICIFLHWALNIEMRNRESENDEETEAENDTPVL